MTMIKNLIFDFGNVLVSYDFMAFLDRFFGDDKEREEVFAERYISPEFLDICDREAKPFGEMIAEQKKADPQMADGLQYFHDRFDEIVTGEMPGMKELLVSLKEKGYRLYGLTNWSSSVYKVIDRYNDLFGLLDGCIISSEEKLIKPEREIFMRLCDRYDLKPDECLFADDKPVNVEGARCAGLNAVVFTDTPTYVEDLKKFGIENTGQEKGTE